MSDNKHAMDAWHVALTDSLLSLRKRHQEFDDALFHLCQKLNRDLFAKRPSTAVGKLHRSLPLTAETWVFLYERLRHWNGAEDDLSARRQAGTYFTPKSLVEPIVRHSLEPVLRLNRASESVRVLDPACGAGAFLIAAGEYLAQTGTGKEPIAPCRRRLARECLKGIEIHAPSAEAARLALRLWSGEPGEMFVADTIDAFARPGGRVKLLQQLKTPSGFDAVLGNPPFANAIEGELAGSMMLAKSRRKEYFPHLTGTADLSYYFLDLADRLTKPSGRVGFVLPRAALAARSARGLRDRLTESRPPRMIFSPSNPLLFSQADVFVAAVVLGEPGTCQVSRSNDHPAFETRAVTTENWWTAVVSDAPKRRGQGNARLLGDAYTVIASMTAGMAYDVKPFVRDMTSTRPRTKRIRVMRLVTTGLIDPNRLLWGEKRCRYLGCHYDRPMVEIGKTLPKSLRDRFQRVRRPKVLVAGLSNRVEAVLDEVSDLAGAVSTYSIFHADDDVNELRKLCDYLASKGPSRRLQEQLGATALSGGRVTITKEFLVKLPLPRKLFE